MSFYGGLIHKSLISKESKYLFCWSFKPKMDFLFGTSGSSGVSQWEAELLELFFWCTLGWLSVRPQTACYYYYCLFYSSLADQNRPEAPSNHVPNPVCSSPRPGDAPESGRPVHADRRRRRRGVCLAGPRPQTTLHLPWLRRRNPLHGHVTWPKVPRPPASSSTHQGLIY